MLKHPYFKLLFSAIKGFFKELPMIHSAALSYYVLLAFVPLLYLSFSIYSQLVGQDRFLEIMKHVMLEYFGFTDVSGFMELINQVNITGSSPILQLSGAFMIVFSVTQILNSLKLSINKFYGIEVKHTGAKRVILRGLIFRLISILVILGFTLLIVLLYFTEGIFMSLGQKWLYDKEIIHHLYLSILKHLLPIITNFIVLTIIYKFLHDGLIKWSFAIKGAIAGAFLFYLGQLLLKVYLSNYFFASGSGMAGSILVMMVWVYYSAMIIFLGARFTADYAFLKGSPVESRA